MLLCIVRKCKYRWQWKVCPQLCDMYMSSMLIIKQTFLKWNSAILLFQVFQSIMEQFSCLFQLLIVSSISRVIWRQVLSSMIDASTTQLEIKLISSGLPQYQENWLLLQHASCPVLNEAISTNYLLLTHYKGLRELRISPSGKCRSHDQMDI